MTLPTLEHLEGVLGGLEGRKILVRANFDVPIVDGEITDDLRILASVPTIEWLESKGASVTLCSHLGRPKSAGDPAFSLDPVEKKLAELGISAPLLPNLRYSDGEKSNDEAFTKELAQGFDGFVNDGFGVSHRAAASVVGLPGILPSAAGRSVVQEIDILDRMLADPGDNFVAVLGGLKISDKLPVVESLLKKVDALCIGGAMAFTFLVAMGKGVGDSLVEDSMVDKCKEFLASPKPIYLPTDFVAMQSTGTLGEIDDTPVENFEAEIPDGWTAADIGPDSGALFSSLISEASTVFWNGPVGAFEDPRFAAGTSTVADAMAETDAFCVVGGGDSASAAKESGITDEVDHVSLGGGACLEYIETGSLVGIDALIKSQERNTNA